MSLSKAQPTFDECKIFLVASDTARDLSLNRDPEYIRFLNLVARTYLLQDDFNTYDALPMMLQTTYKAYAWTDVHEIDISAAAFGASVTEDDTKVLRSFCDETARVVASLLPTQPPTFSPTVYVEETKQPTPPVSFDQDSAQEQNLLPGPSEALSELPIECRRGLFGSDSDKDGYLNPEEYTMFASRLIPSIYSHGTDYDKLPQELKDNFERLKEDGGSLLNIFGAVPSQWAEASSQQRSFLQLICYRTEDALQAFAQAKEQQQQINSDSSQGTTIPIQTYPPTVGGGGGALASIKTKPPTTFPPLPTTMDNQTSLPSTSAPNDDNNTVASNVTNPPTVTPTTPTEQDANHNNIDSKPKKKKNVVVAVVGSILIVLLGLYMARDKQSSFRQHFHRFCRQTQISPFRPGTNRKDNTTSEQCLPTNCDLDSSEEQTGFLEDNRMELGTNLLSVTTPQEALGSGIEGDEESQVPPKRTTSSGYGFQTVRFNPDEFSAPPPQYASSGSTIRFNPDDFIEPQLDNDEEEKHEVQDKGEQYGSPDLSPHRENMINADFQDYQYDDTETSSDTDSSAMSLYCSSVADEKVPSPQHPHGSVASKVPARPPTHTKKGSMSTAETDLLTEFSSPRRSPNTMYHANRFGRIAQSESRSDSGGSIPSSKGKQPLRGGKKSRPKKPPIKQPPPARATNNKPPPSEKQQDVSGEPKTPRAANKKKIKKKPSNRQPPDTAVNAKKKNASGRPRPDPKMPIPKPVVEPEEAPVDRFLRYAMDMSDTSSRGSHSTGFFMAEDPDQAGDASHSTGFFMVEEPSYKSSPNTSQAVQFSYGGKAYSIDAGEASPRPQLSPSNKKNIANKGMTLTEITTGQEHDDSVCESTSFLSDDFTYCTGDDLLSLKNSPPTPHATRRAGKPATMRATQVNSSGRESQSTQTDKRKPRRSRAKTPDMGDEKPHSNESHRDSLSLDESINSLGSCNSLLRDSKSSNKYALQGDGDSTYVGTASHTSTSLTFPPESSSSSSYSSIQTPEGDPIQEIHRLVAILMPSEQGKVTRMLDQYQGREVELLKTLKRLEVRMKARRFAGRAKHSSHSSSPPPAAPVSNKNDRATRMRTIRQQAQQRRQSSIAVETPVTVAAASNAKDAIMESRGIYSGEGGPRMPVESERSDRLLGLDLSSSEECEDDFSQDSTYFEDQKSSSTSFHVDDDDDESLSIYSDLR